MSQPFLSRKMQHVYSVAERYLALIDVHPRLVNQGVLGYFMAIENIKEHIGSLDPRDWYKNQYPKEEEVSFDDLPIEDQIKLQAIMDDLMAPSMSQDNLEEKCRNCGYLADEFGHKILARKPSAIVEALENAGFGIIAEGVKL